MNCISLLLLLLNFLIDLFFMSTLLPQPCIVGVRLHMLRLLYICTHLYMSAYLLAPKFNLIVFVILFSRYIRVNIFDNA